MSSSTSTLERRPAPAPIMVPAPAPIPRHGRARALEEDGPQVRILRELRRCPGRVCRDALLRHVGWGVVRPALREYPRLMALVGQTLADSGEGRLERVSETGWILHPPA